MASSKTQVCDTCGDVGFADCLVVCSQCKEGTEHVYCMATIPMGTVAADWVCERCKPCNKTAVCGLKPRKRALSNLSNILSKVSGSSQRADTGKRVLEFSGLENNMRKPNDYKGFSILSDCTVAAEEDDRKPKFKLKDQSFIDSKQLENYTSKNDASDLIAEPKDPGDEKTSNVASGCFMNTELTARFDQLQVPEEVCNNKEGTLQDTVLSSSCTIDSEITRNMTTEKIDGNRHSLHSGITGTSTAGVVFGISGKMKKCNGSNGASSSIVRQDGKRKGRNGHDIALRDTTEQTLCENNIIASRLKASINVLKKTSCNTELNRNTGLVSKTNGEDSATGVNNMTRSCKNSNCVFVGKESAKCSSYIEECRDSPRTDQKMESGSKNCTNKMPATIQRDLAETLIEAPINFQEKAKNSESGSKVQSKDELTSINCLSRQRKDPTQVNCTEIISESKTRGKNCNLGQETARVNTIAQTHEHSNLKRATTVTTLATDSISCSVEVTKHGQELCLKTNPNDVTDVKSEYRQQVCNGTEDVTKVSVTNIGSMHQQQLCNGTEDVTRESISSNDSITTCLRAPDILDTCSASAAECPAYGLDKENLARHHSLVAYIAKKLSLDTCAASVADGIMCSFDQGKEATHAHDEENMKSACQLQVCNEVSPSVKALDSLEIERLAPATESKGSIIDDVSTVKEDGLEMIARRNSVGAADPRLSSYRCIKCNKLGHLAKMCTDECVEPRQKGGTEYDQSSTEKNVYALERKQKDGSKTFLYEQLSPVKKVHAFKSKRKGGNKSFSYNRPSPERNVYALKSKQKGGIKGFMYDQSSPKRNVHAWNNKRKGGSNFLYDESSPERKVHNLKSHPYSPSRRNINRNVELDVINERHYSNWKNNGGRRVSKFSPLQLAEKGLDMQTKMGYKRRRIYEKYRCNKKLKLEGSLHANEGFSPRSSFGMFCEEESDANVANGFIGSTRDVCLNGPHSKAKFHSSIRNVSNRELDYAHCRSDMTSGSSLPTYLETGLVHAAPDVQILWSGRFLVDWTGSKVCYEGFQAHPSNLANPKVWETMRNLPSTLHLEVLKRGEATNTWPKTFQEQPPTSDCIGVYFFPVDMESYAIWYKLLVDRVSTQDLVLRLRVDVAQLLIFPSCLLPKEEQCWDRKHFLWGVFRANKSTGESSTMLSKLPQLTSVDEIDNGEVIDMEIDMVGGKDIL